MSKITVYGSSDDLIEVEGDLCEEFTYGDDSEQSYLGFSDGTVLSIHYTNDGVWRIAIGQRGSMSLNIEQAPLNDDDNYSDVATLTGETEGRLWCIYGNALMLAPSVGGKNA